MVLNSSIPVTGPTIAFAGEPPSSAAIASATKRSPATGTRLLGPGIQANSVSRPMSSAAMTRSGQSSSGRRAKRRGSNTNGSPARPHAQCSAEVAAGNSLPTSDGRPGQRADRQLPLPLRGRRAGAGPWSPNAEFGSRLSVVDSDGAMGDAARPDSREPARPGHATGKKMTATDSRTMLITAPTRGRLGRDPHPRYVRWQTTQNPNRQAVASRSAPRRARRIRLHRMRSPALLQAARPA